MAEEQKFNTYLTKANDAYMPMIERQMSSNQIEFSDYAKRCVMNAIGTINQMLDRQGINFSHPSLDQSNFTSILLNVAHLELNAIAQPSECYFQIRNVKTNAKDEKGNDVYKKQIEFGIQADGYDAILSRFGRNVKKVYPHWLVREGDHFEYPMYNGLEFSPPKWQPTGTGKVVRVVYPVLHTDNTIHFYIGERDDVLNNLLAHINNNLMNETFGIAKSRYNASKEQLEQISQRKAELKAKAKSLGWDVLDDPEFDAFISPSWKEDFSRESMIIRKMRNNIVKKIPKDFGSPAIFESFNVASDEGYSNVRKAIEEKTGVINVEAIPVQEDESKPQPEENPGSRVDNRGYAGNAATGAAATPDSESLDNRTKPNFG